MAIEGFRQHPLTRGYFANLSKRRVGRLPEKFVDVEMSMPEASGDRGAQSRRTRAGPAEDMDSVG
jgi:hypothetical protein